MNLKETLFCIVHPRVMAKEKKPSGLRGPQVVTLKGGVQLEDWSEVDQARMLKGEHPRGIPTHRNV